MKIIYHFRVRGSGAERVHIAGISNALRSNGHTVTFVSPSGVDPTSPEVVSNSTPKRNSIATKGLHFLADHMPQIIFEFIELMYNIFGFISLRKEVSKIKPDIIYERYAFFNFSGALVASMMNIPLVVEVNELAGHKRVRGQILTGIARTVEKYVFKRAHLISTVSQFLTENVERITQGQSNTITIPNGVGPEWKQIPKNDEVDRIHNSLKINDSKVICFVGGLVPWHNFELLLKAIQLLRQKFDDVRLIIVGDGPLRSFIESKAKLCGIGDEVILVGKVPHDSVRSYIAASDIAVIPETNDYRSPIKMFEYMAMTTPVVAPRKPCIEAVINDGIDGFLFDAGNAASLYEAMCFIFKNRDISIKAGLSARDKIIKSYLWEHHAKKIIDKISTHQISCPARNC